MRVATVVTAALIGLFVMPVTAVGSPKTQDPNCLSNCNTDTATVTAEGASFGITQKRRTSDRVPGRGGATDGEAPGKTTWTKTEEYITPMCSMNGLNGADGMCMAAVTYCQDGRVGFWVWHRVTTFARDAQGKQTNVVGSWNQEDGAFCLGADDPGVPTIGKVISRVQDMFLQNDVGILPLAVKATPAPKTLVNLETRFSGGTGAVVDIPVATPWANVVIHAKPLRWRWHFGDATPTQVTSVPAVGHVYRRPGLLTGVRVDVEWGGTFSVAADPTAYPIVGTAVVQGTSVTMDVREARSQLVSR